MAIFETGALREAKCCRRLRGSVGTPGLAPGDYHYLNRRPSGVWQFLRQGFSVELSAAAAFAAQHCAELSMGSRPRLSAAAAFAAQHCAELSMGSRPRLSAAAAFAAQHCAELSMGSRPRLSAVAAFAAQHCAELSMGSRPRLSAAAAFAAQRDGGIRFHGLTPTAKCCRRLRGSVGSPGLTPGGLPIKNPVPAAPGGRRIPRRRLVAKNLFSF